MGADAAWPLHKAISNCLVSSEKLQAFLGNPLPLFDCQSQDGPLPRLAFGDSRSRAWQSATFDGQEHEITLHLWSPAGDADRSRQIAGEIINLLHDADLPVPGHALVDMQFESSETRQILGATGCPGTEAKTAGAGAKTAGSGAEQINCRAGEGACHCLLTFKGLTVSD